MEEKTDFVKLTEVYDELGIKYHLITNNGWKYVQKMGAHDKPGFLYVMGHGLVELKSEGQMMNFIEFDKQGKIASW